MVAATGEGSAFFINGLTFVAVIVCLLLMRNLPRSSAASTGACRQPHGGRHALYPQPALILVLISLVAVSAFLSMPYSTLMPVFAGKVLQEAPIPVVHVPVRGAILRCQAPEALPLGLLLTTVGLGALVGAAMASLPDTSAAGACSPWATCVFPLRCWLSSSRPSWSCRAVFRVGISFVAQNALANTLMQIITPDAVRGRVMSVYTLTFQAFVIGRIAGRGGG